MNKRNWAAVIALTVIATPVVAAAPDSKKASEKKGSEKKAPESQTKPAGTLTHVATGFRFPAMVAGFDRVAIHAFNSAATDISISYASLTPGAQVAVTVYITPAPTVDPTSAAQAQSCGRQFAAMDRRITQVHPDARQLVLGDVRSPSSQYTGTGKQVIYDYEDVFYGQRQTLRSETDLYCYVSGNWLIAYRTTAPVKVDYASKLAIFMHALTWPAPGSGKPIADMSAPAPVANTPLPAAVASAPAPANAISPNRVLVRLKAAKEQAALAGLVVSGTDQDLQRFEAAASQRGVTASRMTENGKTESIASLLKPEIKLADATDLYRHARDGKFGKLKLEVMLLPPSATGEERDLLSRAAIVPATAIEAF